MSGTIGGSAYGKGFYGKGPYGRATRILGIAGASVVRVRPAPLIAQAQLNITSASMMTFAPTIMWAAIPVDPCVPWDSIGLPGCWQARPNGAGGMFP